VSQVVRALRKCCSHEARTLVLANEEVAAAAAMVTGVQSRVALAALAVRLACRRHDGRSSRGGEVGRRAVEETPKKLPLLPTPGPATRQAASASTSVAGVG
jgi:hypothetical protein